MIHRPKRVIACPIDDCEKAPSKEAPPFCKKHKNYATTVKTTDDEGSPLEPSQEKVLIVVTGEAHYHLRRTVAMRQEEYLELLKASLDGEDGNGRSASDIAASWLESNLMDAINGADDGEIEEGEFSFYRPEAVKPERKRPAKKKGKK